MIALIERLVARGHAYPAGGDVYFSVGSVTATAPCPGAAADMLAREDAGHTEQQAGPA